MRLIESVDGIALWTNGSVLQGSAMRMDTYRPALATTDDGKSDGYDGFAGAHIGILWFSPGGRTCPECPAVTVVNPRHVTASTSSAGGPKTYMSSPGGEVEPKSAERNMPRLLPRLLKALQETPSNAKRVPLSRHVGACKRKSLYRPIPGHSPPFQFAGRTRSFLLEENPVTDKRAFKRHKRLPPRVRLGSGPLVHGEHDVPREMTTQEREWWSSPYRTCDRLFLPLFCHETDPQQSECWLPRSDDAYSPTGVYPTVCVYTPVC